jgi:hypothetical protein
LIQKTSPFPVLLALLSDCTAGTDVGFSKENWHSTPAASQKISSTKIRRLDSQVEGLLIIYSADRYFLFI